MFGSVEEEKAKIEKMIFDNVQSLFEKGQHKPFDVGLPFEENLVHTMLDTVKMSAHHIVERGIVSVDLEHFRIGIPDDFEMSILAALPYAVPEMAHKQFSVMCEGDKIGEIGYGGEITPYIDGTILRMGYENTFIRTMHTATIEVVFDNEEKDTQP